MRKINQKISSPFPSFMPMGNFGFPLDPWRAGCIDTLQGIIKRIIREESLAESRRVVTCAASHFENPCKPIAVGVFVQVTKGPMVVDGKVKGVTFKTKALSAMVEQRRMVFNKTLCCRYEVFHIVKSFHGLIRGID